ncbi:uncharacterized protein LOC114526311 [Dendronephthya gigantea]|uniref:uncharacterized protein LOC114526311 n=1 Tax=Dendronephthya gigantea TaxID=151771 RepID=UPI00106CF85B|nr:uncharacterized protein LOC114526311 [Dendronephthya gigantea]XP_028403683.1 uncharacterized protein LOC114526311 [Dendronephthya gigantea]
MSFRHSVSQIDCPFTNQSIELAYGPEVSLFLHCHLRGYDREGKGISGDHDYYDKYGAPAKKDDSWEEGYHVVEKRLAEHYNTVVDNKLNFPLVAGMGGGVHIYKTRHNEEPWNWTGWIPRQKRWLSQGTFFSNRFFLGLRGNEIQNNLWDYDPHDEEENESVDDLMYTQIEPNDRYRGGYWFQTQPFGRYLHLITLKSHEHDPDTKLCLRYNYIVHPLAYRPSVDTIPDNSVDAMQWAIINMPEERHFGEGKPWGDKCHGLEIFNDFTYFYSYQPLEKNGPNNSELCEDPQRTIDGDNYYYFWYDTYPMEFAVFLLDSALARGVYFHTMSANDAFYERSSGEDDEPNDILLADPKGGLVRHNMKHRDASKDSRLGVLKTKQPELTEEEKKHQYSLAAIGFLKQRPYGLYTSFGYVTLLDPRLKIKNAVFKEEKGILHMGLDDGETLALQYLVDGKYFSTTGLFKLFKYEFPLLPFRISRQPDKEDLCYDLTKEMELEFTFLKSSDDMHHLIWRYTIMVQTKDHTVETSHGYFKLSPDHTTVLDLTKTYHLEDVKFIYFTAISPKNPQHRAWFHAIRGPAFGNPWFHAKCPELKHNVVQTSRNHNTVTASKEIEVTAVDKGDLDFALKKDCNERDIYVYFMQAYPHQQDFSEPVSEKIKESSDLIPPRILQSVHGYFSCKDDHPTRINLSASWDKDTVKDEKVYFYHINADTGEPSKMEAGCEPKQFGSTA